MIDRACISLGEKCNLRCGYCHFKDRLSGNAQEFTIQELVAIIDNISSYCISNKLKQFKVGIVGSGEPLFEYAKIKELINHVQRSGYNHFSFYTITNGTIINDEMIQFFYQNKKRIAICFSLDGYEELHNIGREQFKKAYQGIARYEAVFSKKPIVNCTVHKWTIHNSNTVRQFFTDEGFTDVTFSRLVDSNNESLTITELEYSKFIQDCVGFPFSVRQLKAENSKKYDCTMYGKLCGVGKTNIFITKQGIYPCGRFYGNQKYNYASFCSDLHEIEVKMGEMKELNAGECYYDKYVRGQK
ncbi:radical SAM protein [Desulfovibrio subterraneus]|uniref:radical SAM protein n=1 Tax=Desulfovibrio subterraneus TaxID=2718620 RepID=UPI0022B911BF|nr:radical SAM protein [Desulfovibrio subterraneus]WBF66928.1 radical SAM protein [Desulfovibrio subterraneus]